MYRGWGGLHHILYSLGVHLSITSLQGTPEGLLGKVVQQQYYKRMLMRECSLAMITHFLLASNFRKRAHNAKAVLYSVQAHWFGSAAEAFAQSVAHVSAQTTVTPTSSNRPVISQQ